MELRELMQKRSAADLSAPPTMAMPVPIRNEVIRRATVAEVLREVRQGQKRGEFGAAGPVVHLSREHGGGYAVKVARIKEAPVPMPVWARACVAAGAVLIGISLAGAVLLFTLSLLVESLAALPWALIIGGAVVVAGVAALTRPGRACVEVVVRVFH